MALELKNKRGDISITILVIGVFVVCAFAIIAFIIYKPSTSNGFVNANLFEDLYSQVENYYFYLNAGLSPQQAVSNINQLSNANVDTGGSVGEHPASSVHAQIIGNQIVFTAEQDQEAKIFGFITGSKSNSIISLKYVINANG